MKTTERAKKVEAAMVDLKTLYRKHGFEITRVAMNRYQAALREKNSAEKVMREMQAKLEKAKKIV